MLPVKKLNRRAIIPTRAHSTDAGLDLYALEGIWLWPNHEVIKVRTGIAIEIPFGHYGKISDRSSLGSKGIITVAGVIDCSYSGEIIVCLSNITRANYFIKPGDKIAQLIIQPCSFIMPVEVNVLPETERNINGFGSTGK